MKNSGELVDTSMESIQTLSNSELLKGVVFNLTKKNDSTKHAKIDIIKMWSKGKYVMYIANVQSHIKGIGRMLMYIVACRAQRSALPIEFLAVPDADRPEKLYTYYNSLQFKRYKGPLNFGRGPAHEYLTEQADVSRIVSSKIVPPHRSSSSRSRKSSSHKSSSKTRKNSRSRQ